jgi:glyoxylase-like metal-dependent hydrolase (beta-lactamase superfamily II)
MRQDLRNLPEVCFGKNVVDAVYNQVTIKGDTPDALELKVFFNGFYGFSNTSTLIYGKRDAILVSAAFLLSDAYKLAAGILETGKNLTHVLVPEYHPDHYFSAKALQDAFPDVKIVAMESVIRDIRDWYFGSHSGLPGYLTSDKNEMWAKIFGKNVPDKPCLPMPLAEGRLEVEGHVLEISDGWNGDVANETLVWIPSIRTAIPTDMALWHVHPWTIESDVARRQAWKADLKKLQAMDPKILIPGHVPLNNFNTDAASVIDFTIGYLNDFDDVLAKAKTGDELVEYMEGKYPDMPILRYALHWQARFAFPGSCSDKITPLPGILG